MKTKDTSIKWALANIALGVLILCGIFVYYGFHLGVKPCKGLPSDASNCGDGDFGGLYFLIIGVPITLFGMISLAVSIVSNHFKKKH